MRKNYIFLALVMLTGIAMLLADFLLLVYFGNLQASVNIKFAIPALVFFVLYTIVLGRSAFYFSPGFFTNIPKDVYYSRLKKIGATPILLIGFNVIIHLVFLGFIYLRNDYLDIEPAMKTPLFLASFAFGMLVGTFIYVISDGLVSSCMLDKHLTFFPKELRENRQALKSMIIPVAVAVLSVLFGSSVVMLSIFRIGGDINEMHGSSWLVFLIPTAIFIVFVIVLAMRLKKNTSRLYTSIILQM